MISNLFVYEVYNVQLFAFKIVHDDACHPIHCVGNQSQFSRNGGTGQFSKQKKTVLCRAETRFSGLGFLAYFRKLCTFSWTKIHACGAVYFSN